ncbi:pantetheine-phosphate adenylyltransferase [Anthocerotibacter panamensis]|uniref:pantetheine-phosphate adenylyltransferase n=1 Tax=Anthocerotibacter panamensis TaxID=2857077 RepID=UPI001C4058BF|nr:pantetheine-phosphate adenylyltransferase [Anthocerotibacter panamensis]
MIALYPGSFDPITLGHLDLIERASRLYERVIVAVAIDSGKSSLFSVAQRQAQIEKATVHLPNVVVDSFDGLTVEFARAHDCRVLLRGLRAVSDFEYELQMAQTNRTLSEAAETVFLVTAAEYSFLSSSTVRQIARLGGPVSHLVPPHVERDLREQFRE